MTSHARRDSLVLLSSLAVLAVFAVGVASSVATENQPDRRWSLIYVLEDVQEDVTPGPVVEHGSLVQRANRAPTDSPDVAVRPSSSVTQSENSVAVHPTDPNIVFVSNNATPWPVTGVYGTGVYWSTDGGATWDGDDTGPGGVGNSGDPAAVIRALDGRWAVGYISGGGGQGVSYTTNMGTTWSHRTVSSSSGLDKNHMEVDNVPTSPYYGRLYSSWVNLGGGANVDDIEISRSTDGGGTWSPVQNISSAVSAGSHNQGVNIRIGPNGEVYAAWSIYDSWPSDETAIGFNTSTDGGITWLGETRKITNIRGHRNTSLPNTSIRRNSFPAMAVDLSSGPNAGNIYIVWTNIGVPGVNVGEPDIYLARSTDGGATFGTPVRVNQDVGTNSQWFPWISCDPVTGQLAIIFFDRREDPANSLTRAYMAVSNDGGLTFDDFAVGDASFTPIPISGLAGGYMGDYLGIAVSNGRAYPTWSDNRSGNMLCYVSPILVADPTDPNPPSSVAAFSDFTTPTSVALSWTDPTTYADGSPLGDFSIDVLRDDVFLTNVDQGIEALNDVGLVDGQQYKYTLTARDDVTDSLSVAVEVFTYAGGSPYPAAPTGVTCVGDNVSASLSWTNPSTQSDGTTLDDFAGVRIYRNNSFVVELARAPGDAGTPDSYVDNPPPGFVYSYEVSAIDSEVPVNESARTAGGDCFVGDVPEILVWEPSDVIGTSGAELFATLATLGESVFYSDNLFEFGPDLNAHDIVVAAVGIYSNNHIITAGEGAALEDFVNDGGGLYLECGDCFNYDPEAVGGYNIRPIFGLADGPDGSADLSGILGINDLSGFNMSYAGQNNYIDELQAVSSSPVIRNSGNSDIVGVFEPSFGLGRSIGASFEFGGLVDAGSQSVLVVAADDPSRIVGPRGGYEGPALRAGPDFVKEAERVPRTEDRPAVVKRAANSQSPSRIRGAVDIDGALQAATLANTKADLMAAYLTLLRATGDPIMIVTPDTVSVTLLQGETAVDQITVSNPGTINDPLTYTVVESPDVGWLSISPSGDTVPANGTSIVTLDFDTAALAPGIYTTSLDVAGNDPVNPMESVAVVFTVQGVPDISVMPASLDFSVAPLQTDVASVTIKNVGTDVLNYSLSLATGASGSGRHELNARVDSLTAAGRYRGNVYEVDVSLPLKQIDHYLTLTGVSKLQFFVYEHTAATGTFNLIFSTNVNGSAGTGWYSSGPIDVPLVAGNYYFIGTAWLSAATYYHDAGATTVPTSVPFGSIVGPAGGDVYPPPSTTTVSTGSIIHSQALEYGVSADVQILSATAGALAAAESTLVDVEVTGGPAPGDFAAELEIVSDDPDTGVLVVPITIHVVDSPTASPDVGPALPARLALHPAAPNPFRASTVIRYDLPAAGRATLRIYDAAGRLVTTLEDGVRPAGFRSVTWSGRNTGGERVSSGVYFYTLETDRDVIRRKMVLLR